MTIKLDGHIRIQTVGTTMVATISPDEYVVWEKGSHTANIYASPRAIAFARPFDAFTFAWAKDTTSQLDFTLALETHYLCSEPRRIF